STDCRRRVQSAIRRGSVGAAVGDPERAAMSRKPSMGKLSRHGYVPCVERGTRDGLDCAQQERDGRPGQDWGSQPDGGASRAGREPHRTIPDDLFASRMTAYPAPSWCGLMNGTKEVRISLHQEDESAFPANYPVAS